MLVPSAPCDWNRAKFGKRRGNLACVRDDGGQNAGWNPEVVEQRIRPASLVDVEEKGAGGVGCVSQMLAAGEVPDQPGVDRAETNFAAARASFEFRIGVEQPPDLACREIGIED